MRANAGRLRRTSGWPTRVALVYAQPGRESGSLGGTLERSLSARPARQAFATDHHRWLSRFSGSNSDGLSARAASALLVHKMRNIREKGRVRDRDELKQMAQAIYLAKDRKKARAAFRCFKLPWQTEYPTMVKQLEKDLPDLLAFFSFPKHRWKQLRTTNIIERCFVEVRRRTRPMVCFVNVKSVDRIIYSIFYRFHLEWKTRTLDVFTQAA